MTALMAMGLSLLMIGTAFLSGIFGMAGGLILIGVLLVVFPLPTAMVLHAVTQMASNGWRAMLWWRYIRWRPALAYVAGCAVVLAIWTFWQYDDSGSLPGDQNLFNGSSTQLKQFAKGA